MSHTPLCTSGFCLCAGIIYSQVPEAAAQHGSCSNSRTEISQKPQWWGCLTYVAETKAQVAVPKFKLRFICPQSHDPAIIPREV